MATIADTGFPNLVNVTKRLKPGGGVETDIAELLSKELPMLEDVPWVRGNLDTGHRITSRTGLPSPTWRKLNEGVDPSKSETAQYDEICGMLETFTKVDVALAQLAGDASGFRKSEDDAQIEGYSQEVARAIFYESSVLSPERIHGLSPRYSSTSGITAAAYVEKEGTLAGSNCQSIWLINWEPGRVYGIYPKHSVAGLSMRDLGEKLVRDANNKEFLALVSHFKWQCGLAVQDYRYAFRYQWDPDDTTTHPDSGKSLYLAMQRMLNKVKKVGPRARFYMSRTSKTKIDAQLASNSANFLEHLDAGGKRLPHFMGVPIRIDDTLVGESPVT